MQFDEHKNTQKWRKTEHKKLFFLFLLCVEFWEKKKFIDPHGGKVYHLQPPIASYSFSLPFHFVLILSYMLEFSLIHFLYPMTLLIKYNFYGYYFNFFFLLVKSRSSIWMSWWLLIFNTLFINSVSSSACLFMPTWIRTSFSQLSSFVLWKWIFTRQLELISCGSYYFTQFNAYFWIFPFFEVNIISSIIYQYCLHENKSK
jgi:hypothetical protein